MASRSEKLLILGDFNIHICCASKPMVSKFLCLVDLFNLVQSVLSPTYLKGHTLDLVLSSGFSVSTPEIVDIGISDHFLVMSEFTLPCPLPPLPYSFQTHSCSSTYLSSPRLSSFCTDIEQLVFLFNSSCTDTLDCITPLKFKRAKPNRVSIPWLNESTRASKQAWRAERKWKKDKLQVSYEILRDCLKHCQHSVKTVKVEYYASLINKNVHRPKILFKTINPGASVAMLAPTTETCIKVPQFLH